MIPAEAEFVRLEVLEGAGRKRIAGGSAVSVGRPSRAHAPIRRPQYLPASFPQNQYRWAVLSHLDNSCWEYISRGVGIN